VVTKTGPGYKDHSCLGSLRAVSLSGEMAVQKPLEEKNRSDCGQQLIQRSSQTGQPQKERADNKRRRCL